MELVSINGILQHTSSYYTSGPVIRMYQAPSIGDQISITNDNRRTSYTGDGTNTVFNIPLAMPNTVRPEFEQLFEDLYHHKDNTSVRDQLEKLKVVLELLR